MEINRKIKSKKLNTRVDLTAMVSVSFLLIVFFMVTRELAKPQSMYFGLPSNDITSGGWGCGREDRSMTLLLDDNNQIISYSGLIEYPIDAPKQFEFGKNSIRQELIRKNKEVLEYSASTGRPGRGINVIIKPSNKCNYGNLVAILDEMAIANIETYTVVNYFTPEEQKLLAVN